MSYPISESNLQHCLLNKEINALLAFKTGGHAENDEPCALPFR